MYKLPVRLAALIRRAADDPTRRRIGLYAAAGAFDLFLCLGPLTALLLALLPYTALPEQALPEAFAGLAPDALTDLLQSVAGDVGARHPAVLGVSVLAELWSAARLLSGVVRGVRELSGRGRAGYLKNRLLGAAFTLLLLALILGSLALMLFGDRLCAAVGQRHPACAGAVRFLLVMRPLLLLAVLTGANTLLYRSPPGRQRSMPGALAAAAGWLLFTRLYSAALERFGLFGVYGSIAAVIVTLYWTYCSLYILYLGAWTNTLLTKSAADPKAGGCYPADL